MLCAPFVFDQKQKTKAKDHDLLLESEKTFQSKFANVSYNKANKLICNFQNQFVNILLEYTRAMGILIHRLLPGFWKFCYHLT